GGAGAGRGGHPGGQAGGDHHHDGHGHHRQGGQETRPAEDRLEEREEDDGDAGLDAEDDQQGEGAAGQSALAEEAYVEQGGVAAAQFPPDEHGGGDHSDREAGQGDGVAPAALGAFLQYEDQPDDCEGGEQRPDGVEGVGGMVARVGDRPERHGQGDGGQGDRQHEQPPPVGDVHEQCGEEHAEDAASAGDAGPHTDGLAALLLGEGGGDDGQGDRHDDRCADTGGHAGPDHDRGRGGEAGHEAGRTEDGQSGDQHGLAPEPVSDRAERQEQGGQGQGVDV